LRKILFSLILTVQVLAFDTPTAAKIFNKIFNEMSMQTPIRVYCINAKYQKVIQLAKDLKLEKNVTFADIVLVDALSEIPKGKHPIIFTTNLSVFRKNTHAIGAFYWEHGRPKIVFLQSRLQKHNITLSKSFQRYIVKELP